MLFICLCVHQRFMHILQLDDLLARESTDFRIGQLHDGSNTYGVGQLDELLYFYHAKTDGDIMALFENYGNIFMQ